MKAAALLAALVGGVVASPLLKERAVITGHEYIVVGSGAGGGVVAARLALAGKSVLLLEAGDDQGTSVNYSVPAFQGNVAEDHAMNWNFFVRHYEEDSRQALDFKTTYNTPDGGEYTGLNPPAGSTIKGVLYPRAATLGGCTAHNALVAVYPHQKDFQYIADLTGDSSWLPANIRKYFVKLERNRYLQSIFSSGHGYDGWLTTDQAPATLAITDPVLLSMIVGTLNALGGLLKLPITLVQFLAGDMNANSDARDEDVAAYQIPLSMKDGARDTIRDYLVDIASATNADGTQKYPLTIRTNSFVTKVVFNTTGTTPKAAGVEFIDGKALYRADPRSSSSSSGTAGSATASKEVIVAGGAYNTPQILKLSGVGPADELESFDIPVIVDLPGVGTNLQDHLEVAVNGEATNSNFTLIADCTFGFSSPDPCLEKWEAGSTTLTRGPYVSNGFAGGVFLRGSTAPDNNWNEFGFGGPVFFRGYYPGFAKEAVEHTNYWTWVLLKTHPVNTAGTVKLASADPLVPPSINYNYFDTGSGDYNADLTTISEAIQFARWTFGNQTYSFKEVAPGAQVQTQEQLFDYIKNTAWGHHASSTCPIGKDGDPMAVLDSKFQVRGVQGLRVVDASVYPKIPGSFTLLSTYLVGEKAADVILSG